MSRILLSFLALSASCLAQVDPATEPPKAIHGTFADHDVRAVIREIVRGRQADVVVADAVRGKVSLTLDHDSVEAALVAAVAPLGAAVTRDEYGVLCVAPKAAERKPPQAADPMLQFEGTEVCEALLKLAEVAQVNVVVGPGIQGKATATVDARDPLRALQAIAPQAIVGERDGVFRVVAPPPRTPTTTFFFDDVAASTVLETIAHEARQKIEVGDSLSGKVTLQTAGVPWRHALTLAAVAVGAELRCNADGVYIVKGQLPPPQDVNAAFAALLKQQQRVRMSTAPEGLPPADFCRLASMLSRQSVEAAGDVQTNAVVCQVNAPFEQILAAVADLWQADIIELDSGGLRLVPRPK